MRKIEPEKMGELMATDKAKKMYPYFNISTKHLPEAEKWDVGETYHIALEIKQTGLNVRDDGGNAEFEITAIEVLPNKGKKKVYKKVNRY